MRLSIAIQNLKECVILVKIYLSKFCVLTNCGSSTFSIVLLLRISTISDKEISEYWIEIYTNLNAKESV